MSRASQIRNSIGSRAPIWSLGGARVFFSFLAQQLSRIDGRIRVELRLWRLLAVGVQILAVAIALTVSTWAKADPQTSLALEDSQFSDSGGALCETHVGDKAPSHKSCGHAKCCILRNEIRHQPPLAHREDAFRIAPIFAAATSYVAHPIRRDPIAPTIGWASTWSSRAPPATS